MINSELNKETFLKILKEKVSREGIDNLIAWLEKSDFFTAPASTRFHLAEEGGLCEHSLNVYYELCKEAELSVPGVYSDETLAIVALFHDICKANFYTVEMRNKKDENGKWIQVPFYTVDDQLPYGHGEKSVLLLNSFIKLSREEMMAVRWHMGGFDESVKGGSYAISGAYEKYPLCVLTNVADMKSTYLDEVTNDT